MYVCMYIRCGTAGSFEIVERVVCVHERTRGRLIVVKDGDDDDDDFTVEWACDIGKKSLRGAYYVYIAKFRRGRVFRSIYYHTRV